MPLTNSPQVSPSKAQANRQNAQHSTGPRTPEGKARSRLNALQHGQWASHVCWSRAALHALGEDPEEFHHLLANLRLAEGPLCDPVWDLAVEDLAKLQWRRRRLERAWEVWAAGQAKQGDDAVALAPLAPEGEKLLERLDTADRAIDRKLSALLRLRAWDEKFRRRKQREAEEQVMFAYDRKVYGDGQAAPEEPEVTEEQVRHQRAQSAWYDQLNREADAAFATLEKECAQGDTSSTDAPRVDETPETVAPKTAERSQDVAENAVQSQKLKVESSGGKPVEGVEELKPRRENP